MKYEIVSGLETHVELSTKTKIFCGCTTAFGGAPNSHTCPVCTGMPGALPILNRKVLEYAIRAGLATNCKINLITRMDRKNYTYPDLPKAYQISQFDKPVCENGYITLSSGKKIGITRIHIEEDAGKLVHENGYTYVDYNRGGVPLIEIVSEPDISSSDEAKEYIEKLQLIMRYIGVSDCKMQEGSIRCDVNISLRPVGETKFGTRTEIKNMNSLSHIEKAMKYEYERQAEILDNGGKVVQETLRFNEEDGTTSSMRGKEDAQDYRYFPEPDIITMEIMQEEVDKIKAELPELPDQRLNRFVEELKLPLASAQLLFKYKKVADFFDAVVNSGATAKNTANLILGTVYSTLATEEDKEKFDVKLVPQDFAKLVKYVDEGKYLFNNAQKTLTKMLESGESVDKFVKAEDIAGFPEDKLIELCKKAVELNPVAIENYKSGNQKAINALFGFVMKNSQGKANVKRAEEIILNLIK